MLRMFYHGNLTSIWCDPPHNSIFYLTKHILGIYVKIYYTQYLLYRPIKHLPIIIICLKCLICLNQPNNIRDNEYRHRKIINLNRSRLYKKPYLLFII